MPMRVLVCGTNYGGSYVRSLAEAGDRYSLAGLLARGSERSRAAAQRLNVPLYTSVADVPHTVDLACAAMGMGAHPVVLELLSRGVGVLCEHPISGDQMRAALDTAAASRTRFHVNGHWSELDSSLVFAENAPSDPPIHVQLTATDRFLYGSLDILRRAVPAISPVQLERTGTTGPYTQISGMLGPSPATIQVQSSRRPDGSEIEEAGIEYLICYRILLEYSEGTLALLGPGGPVVWNPNESRVADLEQPLSRILHNGTDSKLDLSTERLTANLRSIDALAGGKEPLEQRPEYLLDVGSTWERIGSLLAG